MEWALSISKEEYIKHAEQVLKEFGLDPDTFMYSIEVTAEDYISRGYSIIPIAITKEGTGLEKKPLIRWKEYQNGRATMDEVRKWINEFKYFNIAIVTGKVSNLTVIVCHKPYLFLLTVILFGFQSRGNNDTLSILLYVIYARFCDVLK